MLPKHIHLSFLLISTLMSKTALTFAFIILSFCTGYSQQTTPPYSIETLKARFKHENYTDKVLLEFQNTMSRLRVKPELSEDIPGEVLSWYTLTGEFSIYKTYLISNNAITKVATVPSDEKFLKKLNSYVPEKSRFTYDSDLWSMAFVKSKLEGGYYLIKATTKSFNSYPEIPNPDILSYDIEYKTKDFKQFILVRLKDIHTEKWIEVTQ
jgi:hypothetical protein